MPHEIANPTDLSTRELLAEIIRHAVLAEAEVRFFTPRGEGKAVMQRVRMELSRSRQRNERKGKKNLRFSLHQSIYPWTTLDGKRLERVLVTRSEEHTSELQSLMRNSYDVFCLKKKSTLTRCEEHKTNNTTQT